ncbi:hypothetical protein DPMN_024600 [Dreissena polymorpha]|uniref:Uncharacterized protein n=1 Tax=Dreissena polymorpha TaxID=45954 RepID=A0A9D4LPG5_DREPO|nr:hypothetical protein DPMN_024600 [Dreissena polymorpha]
MPTDVVHGALAHLFDVRPPWPGDVRIAPVFMKMSYQERLNFINRHFLKRIQTLRACGSSTLTTVPVPTTTRAMHASNGIKKSHKTQHFSQQLIA